MTPQEALAGIAALCDERTGVPGCRRWHFNAAGMECNRTEVAGTAEKCFCGFWHVEYGQL